MRWAKSYSIIDHKVFHEGYLHRLSHESLILYLFLVIVGDKDGRSFYGEGAIRGILRLGEEEFYQARIELLKEDLIDYQSPYWWIKNITGGKSNGRCPREDIVSTRCFEDEFSSDRRADWDFAKKCIEDLSKKLGWK
jgi:hypothetical protein